MVLRVDTHHGGWSVKDFFSEFIHKTYIMKVKLLRNFMVLLLILLSLKGISQRTIYVGTKSYHTTNNWSFLFANKYSNYAALGESLNVFVAKSSSGGFLVLSTMTMFSSESISGKVLIYLKDGKVITLINRFSKDYADEEATSLYSLSTSQINQLKASDISAIRISLVSSYDKKGFTAENRTNVSLQVGVYEEKTWNTAQEIEALFLK